ncbi:MAG: SufD family Fe-S cluster assembly protein [Spirochaetaceae bacterium]|nr:SufD family Fe-S cluster assembly protein [Spirochaetaceae bacterium]MDT8298265.1 SufD family Fe-S cluster assembly protein [Spirochaetaceae bacterium]
MTSERAGVVDDLLTAVAKDLFAKTPWPTPEDEPWRRTDLRRLLPKGLLDRSAQAPPADPAEIVDRHVPLLPEQFAARVITERGIPVAIVISPQAGEAGLSIEWCAPADLPPSLETAARAELDRSPDRITSWHWRDFPGSLVVHASRNARIENPVLVEERLIASDPALFLVSAPHLHVEVEQGAQLTVVWSLEGAPMTDESVTPIVNSALTASAAPNSHLNITLRQNLGDRVVLFHHDILSVQRDAHIGFIESHLGGAMVKTRARSILAGEGADVRLNGIYIAGEKRHMDIGTLQEHRAARANSNALYKGAVRSGGRSVFQGLIEVAPKAVKTDAYLTNNNLILGDDARSDSLPQLDILTDDVKCSHGSTTGKLDEGQIFYLRSRGFSPGEAKRELTRAFLASVIDGAPGAVSEILSADLDEALSYGEN